MEIRDLGVRLRARRTAAGETIAAVAVRAGLSVPYIANLENGRGNPTLTALSALVKALGATLRVEIVEAGQAGTPPLAPSASLAKFARSPRFAEVAERLASLAGCSVPVQRDRLLQAMSAISVAVPAAMTELDWHRVLDAMILASSDRLGSLGNRDLQHSPGLLSEPPLLSRHDADCPAAARRTASPSNRSNQTRIHLAAGRIIRSPRRGQRAMLPACPRP